MNEMIRAHPRTAPYPYPPIRGKITPLIRDHEDKQYEYDEIDNMRLKDGNTYTYDDPDHRHAVTSDSVYTYTYDANGNMTEKRNIENPDTDIMAFGYDVLNRLISITITEDGSATSTTYAYDANGGRVKQSAPEKTIYYYSGSCEVEIDQADPATEKGVKYYYANDMRIAMRETEGGVSYFHLDHLGTSMRLTDEEGALTRVTGYEPYGATARSETILMPDDILISESITESGDYMAGYTITADGNPITIASGVEVSFLAGVRVSLYPDFTVMEGASFSASTDLDLLPVPNEGGTRYGFTGQEQDASGLYYYGARYYDPELGRFTQPDTILDGLNRYAYCRNNPVKYIDPTGHIMVEGASTQDMGNVVIDDSGTPVITSKENSTVRSESGDDDDGNIKPIINDTDAYWNEENSDFYFDFEYFKRDAEFKSFEDIFINTPELYRELSKIWIYSMQVNLRFNPKVTDGYGMRTNPITGKKSFHKGRDIAADIDSDVPVVALFSGTVVEISKMDRVYGNAVVLQFNEIEQKIIALSGHLDSIDVNVGDRVTGGFTILGHMGSTGMSTNRHLHQEIQVNGISVPHSVFNFVKNFSY